MMLAGFLLGTITLYFILEIAKYHQWRKWTIDEFKMNQEIELKKFLLWKKEIEEEDKK